MKKSVPQTTGRKGAPRKKTKSESMNDLILVAHSFHNDTFHEAIGWSRKTGVLTWVNQTKGYEQRTCEMNAGDAVKWLKEMHAIAHRFGLQETSTYDGRREFLERIWSQLIHVEISHDEDKVFCRPLCWRPEWLIGKKAFAALVNELKENTKASR